jgi:hypothetical protein
MPSVPDFAQQVLTKPEITQRYTSDTKSVLLLPLSNTFTRTAQHFNVLDQY